jgi:protein required for attachment to host cells
MSSYSASASPRHALWVLVADGKQAHLYECRRTAKIIPLRGYAKHAYQADEQEWDLIPIPEADLMAETPDDYELGHDKRGSIFGNTSSVRHTVEPHMDMREGLKRRFMRTVAAKLTHAYAQKRFSSLIIAAPPRALGELREYLGSDIPQPVITEIPKQLTHCKAHELIEHIKDALPYAHAA